jgi:hypothetical protein
VRPIHAGCVSAATHDGPHESWLAELDLHRVSGTLEPLTIRRECQGDARLGIMEKVEGVAVPGRVGGEVQRCPAGEVAILGWFRGQHGKQRALKRR